MAACLSMTTSIIYSFQDISFRFFFTQSMSYTERRFRRISYEQLERFHPSPYGIFKGSNGSASIQIVKNNSKNYIDAFDETGDFLEYQRSLKKTANKILDDLVADAAINVYFNAKGSGFFDCGVYRIKESKAWGWRLERVSIA